jgi:hypothetical protein
MILLRVYSLPRGDVFDGVDACFCATAQQRMVSLVKLFGHVTVPCWLQLARTAMLVSAVTHNICTLHIGRRLNLFKVSVDLIIYIFTKIWPYAFPSPLKTP